MGKFYLHFLDNIPGFINHTIVSYFYLGVLKKAAVFIVAYGNFPNKF